MEKLKTLMYCFALSSFFFCAQFCRIKQDLKKIYIIDKYYPKHYIQPKKWMKKFLKIKSRYIPKLLYFQFYFTFIYLISTVLCWGFAFMTGEFIVLKYCINTQIALNLIQGVTNLVYGAVTKIYSG